MTPSVTYSREFPWHVTINPSELVKPPDEMIPPSPEQSSILIQTLSAPPAEPHDSGIVRQAYAEAYPKLTD